MLRLPWIGFLRFRRLLFAGRWRGQRRQLGFFIGKQSGDPLACRLVGFHRKSSPKVFDVETSNIASGNIDALIDGRMPRHHSPSMDALTRLRTRPLPILAQSHSDDGLRGTLPHVLEAKAPQSTREVHNAAQTISGGAIIVYARRRVQDRYGSKANLAPSGPDIGEGREADKCQAALSEHASGSFDFTGWTE